MDVRVDWLSFTVPLPEHPFRTIMTQWGFVLRTLKKYTNSILSFNVKDEGWEVVAARGFYKYRAQNLKDGLSFSWGDVNEHIFVEASGIGCEWLRQLGILYDLLAIVRERATRIDIATDIQTDTTPRQFVELSNSPRIKTRSSVTSPTGDTEYVGSRQGERMARVYRYNPPHPRAHLLRIEVEYKGDSAKRLARLLNEANLISESLSANAPFGWAHPIWNAEHMEISKIPSKKTDRDGAATLLWLIDVVVPSIKRMEKEGYFTVREWVETYLLPK